MEFWSKDLQKIIEYALYFHSTLQNFSFLFIVYTLYLNFMTADVT